MSSCGCEVPAVLPACQSEHIGACRDGFRVVLWVLVKELD